MDLNTLFALSNLTVMPFWALMILLPRWSFTRRLMQSPLVALAPTLLYAALVLPDIGALFAVVSNPDLGSIAALLGTPRGALIGWIHFLAFDLLIGRWAYLDSRERGIGGLPMAPILFMILMLGPIGLLLYLVARAFAGLRARSLSAAPAVSAR
jgi:hypothetical protein